MKAAKIAQVCMIRTRVDKYIKFYELLYSTPHSHAVAIKNETFLRDARFFLKKNMLQGICAIKTAVSIGK
jgi:hypothetical protein